MGVWMMSHAVWILVHLDEIAIRFLLRAPGVLGWHTTSWLVGRVHY